MDFESIAEELYGLAPPEFTRARDARVADARKEGDRETAAAVKQLRRPSLGAWLANRIVRDRGGELDHLLALAEQLHQAQARLDGDALRNLSREGRDAAAGLVKDASGIAREHGHEMSASAREDLEATLDAALADPDAADELRTGRLTSALRYSGLGLAGVMATAPSGRDANATDSAPVRRVVVDRELERATQELERVQAQMRDAETAVAAAETTLGQRKEVALRAARRVREAEKAVRDAQKAAAREASA